MRYWVHADTFDVGDLKGKATKVLEEASEAGEEALLEHGIYEGDPFSRHACQDCEPFLEGFWDWCDCESADIPSDFSCYMSIVRTEARECAEMAEAMEEDR